MIRRAIDRNATTGTPDALDAIRPVPAAPRAAETVVAPREDAPGGPPPPVSKAERADIARASVVTTADVDAAGEMWKKYAGDMLGGLWDAG